MSAQHFVEQDTASKLVMSCKDFNTEIALPLGNDVTVRLRYRIDSNPPEVKTMTIVDAVAGIVEYQWLAGELKPGKMKGQVQIIDADERVLTQFPYFEIPVDSLV